jgi:type IV pilus assembly protein PilW
LVTDPAVFGGMPNRWVSAQSIPANQWSQVTAIRVGMILRGPPGSAQAAQSTVDGGRLFPLGQAFVDGSAEAGLTFVAPTDGRLRKAFSATFLLRNRI